MRRIYVWLIKNLILDEKDLCMPVLKNLIFVDEDLISNEKDLYMIVQ